MKQITLGPVESYPSSEGYWIDATTNKIYFAVVVKTNGGGNKIVLYGDTFHTDLEKFLDGHAPLEQSREDFPTNSRFQKQMLGMPKA